MKFFCFEVRGLYVSPSLTVATFGKDIASQEFPVELPLLGREQFSGEECSCELLTTNNQSSWESYYNDSRCLLT